MAIQAGRTTPVKGNEDILKDISKDNIPNAVDVINQTFFGTTLEENFDLKIETPLIGEKKEETVKRILEKHDVSVYEDSYTCYNGVEPSCGKCPACQERLTAFAHCDVEDPIKYA